MKTKPQETSIPPQSIDADELDAVVGGCACGQANCPSAGDNVGQAGIPPGSIPARQPFGWRR